MAAGLRYFLLNIFFALILIAFAACGSGQQDTNDTAGGDPADDSVVPDTPSDSDVPADTEVEFEPPCESRPDADGDTIADMYEGASDPDADTIPNDHDDDSDNDTISDYDEAGNHDTCTAAVDTDGDTTPDFLDPDSDDDGVSDRDEVINGTDRLDEDSDDDGVTDLVEDVYGSDPMDPGDSPRTHGDFVFIVDYMEEPDPAQDTLVFGTDIKMADVYFMIDTSGSMSGEVNNLTAGLKTTIVPGVAEAIPDVQMGLLRFEDCPESSCPNNITNLQSITDDVDAVEAALETITYESLCGGDEPYGISLWITATGDGPAYGLPARSCPDDTTIGYPCFRPTAIPIIVQMGDEPFEWRFMGGMCRNEKSKDEIIATLRTIHAKYIGIDSCEDPIGPTCPQQDMEDVAFWTGSMDAAGTLLVYKISDTGEGLSDQVVNAIAHLANQVPIDVSAAAQDRIDSPEDTVDAARFVDRIEPNTVGGIEDPEISGRICVGGLVVGDSDYDTVPDYFDDVLPGTIVCFDIYAKMNDFVPRTNEPQLYTADIHVFGDWITLLDSRIVYFLIPPEVSIEGPI
ncbi:MAG: vWA domain-containing protein [Pseudomonadota bacterium]